MTYPMEPVLARKSPMVLLRRLLRDFGKGEEGSRTGPLESGMAARFGAAEAGPADPEYRAAVGAALLRLYGCPAPDSLMTLIDQAGRLEVDAERMALFLGREFRLKPLRRYSNNSN